MYIKSNLITVMPAARKPEAESRLTSEDSFTNIMKILSPTGTGSFIITTDDSASEIEFCIEGYYVKVTKSALTYSTVYVSTDYENISPVKELKGTQTVAGTDYLGLIFSNTPSENSLKILDNGTIPKEFTYKEMWKNDVLKNYSPFFISNGLPQNPTDIQKSQICIDSSKGYSSAIYVNNAWVRLGAVAK